MPRVSRWTTFGTDEIASFGMLVKWYTPAEVLKMATADNARCRRCVRRLLRGRRVTSSRPPRSRDQWLPPLQHDLVTALGRAGGALTATGDPLETSADGPYHRRQGRGQAADGARFTRPGPRLRARFRPSTTRASPRPWPSARGSARSAVRSRVRTPAPTATSTHVQCLPEPGSAVGCVNPGTKNTLSWIRSIDVLRLMMSESRVWRTRVRSSLSRVRSYQNRSPARARRN